MWAAERAGCEPGVLAAYDASLGRLADLGAAIVDVALPRRFADMGAVVGRIIGAEGYSFVGDEEQQVTQIKRLIDHSISGLGFGTGFSYDKVPPALVAVAQEYDFPLFEVPYDAPVAIEEACIDVANGSGGK